MEIKNHKIKKAANGPEAVEICLSNLTIDLVLKNIKMPVMDVFEAFGKIKLFRTNLPIIARTAFSSNEDQERIRKEGFTNYSTKPINRERLFEIIDSIKKKINNTKEINSKSKIP